MSSLVMRRGVDAQTGSASDQRDPQGEQRESEDDVVPEAGGGFRAAVRVAAVAVRDLGAV